ncbi:MAG: alpha/beta fold hydrolase [Gemmatimonadaceae bacterium]
MTDEIRFENADGKTLSARLTLPVDRAPHNFALFAHCFTCSKNLIAARRIGAALAARGFGILSFDFTGLGMSEGNFADTNFSSSVADLVCAAGYLRQNHRAPTLIVGHSLGGAASILAANVIDEVTAIATIGAPASPQHVRSLLTGSIPEVESTGEAEVDIGGRPFTIQRQFLDDLERQDLLGLVHEMRKAFLFLHSPQDTIVGIENAAELYSAAFHPKSFIALDGADHLLSRKEDAMYAGDMIASWANRYVENLDAPQLSTTCRIVAHLGSDGSFTTRIRAGRHYLTADEPESVGGNDFGPSPYDLVASGLAACTAMTLRLYANHKKWDLTDVYVHVSHEKKHFEDCLACETSGGKLDHFSREIELVGKLDAEQRMRLLEIADKCPVHRTLESEIHVSTRELARS